jgi:hypothetical protein
VEDAADWLQPYLGEDLLILAPNFRASAVFVDRVFIAAALVPLGFFMVSAICQKNLDWAEGWFWPGAILLLGPLGLVIYWLIGTTRFVHEERADTTQWRSVLRTSTRTAVALSC